MAHEGYHEPYEKLSEAMRSKHRAIISVVEELEAIDWYYQRADVTEDASLKAILLHNAHEEIEHAMMALEWIRRNDVVFDTNIRRFLFREGDIVASEAQATNKPEAGKESTHASPQAPSIASTARPSLGSAREGT